MQLEAARKLAEETVAWMRPFCERVEIAGSIRRVRPTVKDLEIVAVPRRETRPGADLFATEGPVNALFEDWAHTACIGGHLEWIKPGTSEVISWEPKPDGRYWAALIDGQVKLDLFLTSELNFGLIYLIRTGSAEFSKAVVTHARQIGMRSSYGELIGRQGIIPTPEEADVFRALGLEWVEPERRTGPEAVRQRAAR